jgi:guanylate kinase
MRGKLIIFSAPSGSGKTTIVKHLLSLDLNLEFSISATSRMMRINEKDGKDYYFLSAKKFKKKIENGEFVEWEEVYKDTYYGTLKSELERIWKKDNHVVFDIDVIGGLNLKKKFGDDALSIFVQAPSIQELEIRLRQRSSDNDESIKKRLEKAQKEMSYADQFDKILINSSLNLAFDNAEKMVREFLLNAKK